VSILEPVLRVPIDIGRSQGAAAARRELAKGIYADQRPSLLGRVLDGFAKPMDGGPAIEPEAYYDLYAAPPGPLEREPIREALVTGIRSIDTNCTGCNARNGKGLSVEQFKATLPSGEPAAVTWSLAGGDLTGADEYAEQACRKAAEAADPLIAILAETVVAAKNRSEGSNALPQDNAPAAILNCLQRCRECWV